MEDPPGPLLWSFHASIHTRYDHFFLPEPLKGTDWGLPEVLSLMETLAVRLPIAVGLKVTLTVQFAPAAKVLDPLGQVLVCAKSPALVPVRPMLEMVRAAVPLLV